jgi:hypothetical protein
VLLDNGEYSPVVQDTLEWGDSRLERLRAIANTEEKQDFIAIADLCRGFLFKRKIHSLARIIDLVRAVIIEDDEPSWSGLTEEERDFYKTVDDVFGNIYAALKLARAMIEDEVHGGRSLLIPESFTVERGGSAL